MELKNIEYLFEEMSLHRAVRVRKNGGKTDLYLNYYKGTVRIRYASSKLKEILRAKTTEEMLLKLKEKKYQYYRY